MSRLLHYLFLVCREGASWIAWHRPKLGLRIAGLLGMVTTLRQYSWRAPSTDKLTAILGSLPAPELRRLRRRIASQQSRNEALAQVLRHRGVDALVALVRDVHAEPLLRCRREGKPIVVVAVHQGPWRAVSLGLSALGVPALVGIVELSRESANVDPMVRYAALQGPIDDVRFLRRAHAALLDGSVVALHLDCALSGELVTFFGRRVVFGGGVAMLARLTGACLIPATRRFVDFGWAIEVTFHEPVDTSGLDPRAPGFDRELLSRAAQRLEAAVRADPASLRPGRLDWILSAPVDPSVPAIAAADEELLRPVGWRRRRRRERNRKVWEQNWGSSDFKPLWVGRGISPEIVAAVSSGWFAAGGRALDAGCGEGDVAAWLAARGFPSVGVDIAQSALDRARRTHGEQPGWLRFARVDLCAEAPDGGPFTAIVDRGCFLQLDERERRVYAVRLQQVCTDDARLLIYGRAFRDGIPFGDEDEIRRRQGEVMRAFAAYFDLERTAATYLDRHQGSSSTEQLPGIVFWLRRHARA